MAIEPASSALPAGLSANAFSSLFQAVGGLRNRRAIVALLGCLFAGIIAASLVGMMAASVGFFAIALGMLIWVIALGTGINAAGLLQMDQARGISPRSTVDALVYGLLCIPKLLALALIFFAAVLAVFLAIALLLLLCKIPVLGAVLFAILISNLGGGAGWPATCRASSWCPWSWTHPRAPIRAASSTARSTARRTRSTPSTWRTARAPPRA